MQDDRDVLQALSKPDLWKIFEHHADKLGVRVEVANHLAKVAACPSEKIVHGCPIRGKLTLAAMLHELGHIATMTRESQQRWARLCGENRHELLMMEEKIAWTWAKYNCPIWDNEMRDHAKQALISHNGHPEVGDRVLEKMKKELGEVYHQLWLW